MKGGNKLFDKKIVLGFADWLLETSLLEMASDKNSNKLYIQSLKHTLNEHLFKYYLMPNCIDRNHWLKEITSYLRQIDDCYWNKNKHFDFEDYYKWLFLDFFNDDKKFRTKLNNVIKHYHEESMIQYNFDEFKNMCDSFYKIVCTDIANTEYDTDLSELITIFDIN